MPITLEEAKLYLRIDNSLEDALITRLIQTSITIVENVLRHPISDYEVLPDDIKMAILYGVAYLFENRETADFHEMIKLMRALLIPYRKEVF
ncbi:phage gp6-like head-tail connector protein [Blautia liquoris]|uniref:Phage gp6-like head-tail connector protein n=1 Tax=Blautia liquoris TaxID=2779518 RepID=A0A7M2RD34_9FIRM|nr:head-tail connector protein [Blautia liquoris]QOV18196.1 phage gp6-like head-tail connector protein [Blautia liquoris]